MKLTIRPASRKQTSLLVGVYGLSGSGKTYSALQLARGFVGPQGRIAMIETESGRGEVYADLFEYDVISIRDEFSSKIYHDAIALAESHEYDALVIDSASHEWEGPGGVCDAASQLEQKGKKGMAVWKQPKVDHNKLFVQKLLRTPIKLVIVCMRGKYPMDLTNPRNPVRSGDMVPIQDSNFLYEMLIHGWVDKEHRFHVTRYPRPEMKEILPDKQPLTVEVGAKLAEWSRHGLQATRYPRSEMDAAYDPKPTVSYDEDDEGEDHSDFYAQLGEPGDPATPEDEAHAKALGIVQDELGGEVQQPNVKFEHWKTRLKNADSWKEMALIKDEGAGLDESVKREARTLYQNRVKEMKHGQ